MKMPRRPPDIRAKLLSISPEKLDLICQEGKKTENEGKYRHWDILRHFTPPNGLTVEEWWVGIKMKRLLELKPIPLQDRDRKDFFVYNLPNQVLEQLHQIDLGVG